jgi:hypothetical protein
MITGFLSFVHHLAFYEHKRTKFWELDLFPSSGEVWETPTLLDPLETADPNYQLAPSNEPNRVGVTCPSPKDGNRPSF